MRGTARRRRTSFNAEHAEDAENDNGALLAKGHVRALSFSALFAHSALDEVAVAGDGLTAKVAKNAKDGGNNRR